MDSSKKNAIRNSKSEFQRRMRSNKESNENEGHSPRRGFATISQVPKKKILAERNSGDAPLPDSCNTIICSSSEYIPIPIPLPLPSRVRPSDPSPYDPVNNFTSPRPKFLRYNPNRRREILHRMEGEISDGDGSSSDQGKEVEAEASPESFASSKQENSQQLVEDLPGSDAEVDDDTREEEAAEERPWCSRMVWKLPFLFGVFFLFSCHDLFPMSPSTPPPPPLQNQENVNGGSREITPQGPINLLNVDLLLITHMGLSDMCLDVEGLMCAIDEDRSSSFIVVLDELFSEEAHDGNLAIGEQGVNSDLVTSDEVTGMLNSEEEDLDYGIEDTEEKLAEDSSTRGYKSEKVELYYILDNLFSEEKHDVQREENGAEALGAEAMDTDNDIHLDDGHIQPSDAPSSPIGYSEAEIYSGDETEAEESADLAASLPVPLTALALLPQVDQCAHQIEWARRLAILVARARLLFVPMNLLAAALFGLSVCIFRHMLNIKASSSPKLLPRSKSLGKKRFNASVTVVEESRDRGADEKRINPAVIEEFRDEGKDSRLRPLPSNHLTYESDASYATRPPTVQLLGEFSFAEPTVSKIGAGQNSKRTEPEESQLSQYQSKKRSEEDPQFSQYHMRSARKNVARSASKVHPSTASTVDGSHTTQEKLRRTEDTGTPLRRSDRLRNRVTSP